MLNVPKWKAFLIVVISLLSIYLSLPTIVKNGSFPPNLKINLGLDLQGGTHLLLEVNAEQYYKDKISNALDYIKSSLKKENIGTSEVVASDLKLNITLNDKSQANKVKNIVFDVLGEPENIKEEGNLMSFEYSVNKRDNHLMAQTMEIIRKRIDESATKEIDLQMQGSNKILLQVPGVSDPEEVKRLLGKTAKLTFNLVDSSVDLNNIRSGKIPFGVKVLPMLSDEGLVQDYLAVKSSAVITGEMLVDAQATIEKNSMPVVSFKLNSAGANRFGAATAQNVGKRLAIVLDGKIISAPQISVAILNGSGIIQGNFSVKSANELSLLLRAGALPAPIDVIEERTVGPSLGLDSIEAGTRSVIIGLILVAIIMLVSYKLFGLIANIALVVNLFLIISALAVFGATLTLPGIAGMVLTLGMAVDANVLIFERIKEELQRGKSILISLDTGYRLATATILDSNITTIIAAFALYIFGSGPIKAFAVTLTIGLMCSMFTAISLTRWIVSVWYKKCKPKTFNL